ncbi:uncharacterized protein L969DRAFT_534816 [Mixia osmundae IAM 14324]|uniref:uncharacterized protein n=1 Tax=Mixia osmundae (strain CBS 9802 / IAM 14324 / JCM 22182 / KY 12970) TaxID=764103 RepID=UPI0004A54E28|nr:uncharacterized protein L969DRAFT_534816 [Mixia osmundae IAM 14324]KEI38435.1 hypothetical protein L969DRAFT_534816 [Mixia osmundae IAM 14324]
MGGHTLNGRCSEYRGLSVEPTTVLNLTQQQFAVSTRPTQPAQPARAPTTAQRSARDNFYTPAQRGAARRIGIRHDTRHVSTWWQGSRRLLWQLPGCSTTRVQPGLLASTESTRSSSGYCTPASSTSIQLRATSSCVVTPQRQGRSPCTRRCASRQRSHERRTSANHQSTSAAGQSRPTWQAFWPRTRRQGQHKRQVRRESVPVSTCFCGELRS